MYICKFLSFFPLYLVNFLVYELRMYFSYDIWWDISVFNSGDWIARTNEMAVKISDEYSGLVWMFMFVLRLILLCCYLSTIIDKYVLYSLCLRIWAIKETFCRNLVLKTVRQKSGIFIWWHLWNSSSTVIWINQDTMHGILISKNRRLE